MQYASLGYEFIFLKKLGIVIYGFINYLKECDAEVQWALFMPDKVKRQQNGFKVVNYEYKEMPGMRFIGWEDDDLTDSELQGERFRKNVLR